MQNHHEPHFDNADVVRDIIIELSDGMAVHFVDYCLLNVAGLLKSYRKNIIIQNLNYSDYSHFCLRNNGNYCLKLNHRSACGSKNKVSWHLADLIILIRADL